MGGWLFFVNFRCIRVAERLEFFEALAEGSVSQMGMCIVLWVGKARDLPDGPVSAGALATKCI